MQCACVVQCAYACTRASPTRGESTEVAPLAGQSLHGQRHPRRPKIGRGRQRSGMPSMKSLKMTSPYYPYFHLVIHLYRHADGVCIPRSLGSCECLVKASAESLLLLCAVMTMVVVSEVRNLLRTLTEVDNNVLRRILVRLASDWTEFLHKVSCKGEYVLQSIAAAPACQLFPRSAIPPFDIKFDKIVFPPDSSA